MAEETDVPVQDPQPTPYIDKVYSALKDNLQGFNKTPEQFKQSMQDGAYAAKAYSALKDNLQGFNKSQDEFYQATGVKGHSQTSPQPNAFLNPLQQQQNSPFSGVTRDPALQQQLLQQGQHQAQLEQDQQHIKDNQSTRLINDPVYMKQVFDTMHQIQKDKMAQVNDPNSDYYAQIKANREADEDAYNKIPLINKIHSINNAIYGGAGDILKGAVRGAHTILSTVTPNAVVSPERWNQAQENVTGLIDKGVNAGTMDIPKEQQDILNKHGVTGAINGFANFVPAMAAAERTGGASFFFNDYEKGYKNIDNLDKDNGLNLSEGQKQLYATANGLTSMLFMKHNLHSLLGNAGEKTEQSVINAVSQDALGRLAKSGEDLTPQNLSKFQNVSLDNLESRVKNYGLKAIKGGAMSTGDMAGMEGTKIATEKLLNTATGKQIFNQDNNSERMQSALATGAGFGALGAVLKAPMLLSDGGEQRNAVTESLYKNPSQENADNIKSALTQHLAENGLNQADIEHANGLVDQIHEVAKSLPQGLDEAKTGKITSLILERKQLEKGVEENTAQKKGLDPAFTQNAGQDDVVTQHKIDSIDDQIKSIATNTPVKYFKDEEGQPMKQVGNAEPEKIDEERYLIEKPNTVFKNEQPKPNEELPAETPTNEPVKTQEPVKAVDEARGDNKVETAPKELADKFYHATGADFDEYRPLEYGDKGQHNYFYFTKDKNWAIKFGKAERGNKPIIKEANLDLKKPLDMRELGSNANIREAEMTKWLQDKGVKIPNDFFPGNRGQGAAWQFFRFDTGELQKHIKDAGYDGIIFQDHNVNINKTTDTHVVFDKEQIKKATEVNNLTTNPNKDEKANEANGTKTEGGKETVPAEKEVVKSGAEEIPVPETAVKSPTGQKPEVTNESQGDKGVSKINSERQKAIDLITHGLITVKGENDGYSPRIDLEMTAREKAKAVADIHKGNFETAPAKKLIEKVSQFHESGDYPVIKGTGGHTNRGDSIPATEMESMLNDAKQFQLDKERDREAANKGLKDTGFTDKDFEDYERYQREQSAGSNGRTVKDAATDVQRAEDDKKASGTQDAGSKTVQGKSKPKSSLTDEELNRKLELRKKFAGRFNDITNIPTLLADKEFREYAGLVLKEATGDFKQFSKELIDSVGEKIKEHLPQLFKDLGGDEKQLPKDNEATSSKFVTSAKNADTDKLRERLGLSPLMKEAARANPEVWDEVLARLDKNPQATDDLIARLETEMRPVTDVEQGLLVHKQIELETAVQEASQRVIDNKKEGVDDKFDKINLDNERKKLSDLITLQNKVGREWGLSGKFRQQLYKDDFSLASLERKTMAALGGRELTSKELDEIQKVHDEFNKKLKDHEDVIAKLQKRNSDLEAEKALKKLKKEHDFEGRKAKRQGKITDIKEVRAKALEDIRAKLKKSRGSLNAGIPKELLEILPEIGTLAKTYISEGITKLDDIVDRLHHDLKDEFENLDIRDLRDALSGYGKETKKQSKDAIQLKLEEIKREAKLRSRLEDLQAGLKKATTERAKRIINERIADLQKQIHELTKGEAVNKAYITRMKNMQKELEAKLKAGDFDKTVRVPVELTEEARAARAAYLRVKKDFETELEKKRLAGRSKIEKASDWFVKWRRNILFLNPTTFVKLGTYATMKMLSKPLHEIIGAGARKLPGISKIAAKAPREGHGFNVQAEAKAFAQIWSKSTWNDIKNNFKNKEGDLQVVNDGSDETTRVPDAKLLDIGASLHSAIKQIPKHAEFERSLILRTKFAYDHGLDVSNQLVQLQNVTESLKDVLPGSELKNIENKAYQDAFKRYFDAGQRGIKGVERSNKSVKPVGRKRQVE